MGELERRPQAFSGLLQTRQERDASRGIERITLNTKLTSTRVDAEAAMAGRIMERVTDVDGYRRALAGGDETLNAVLTRIELGFIAKAEQIQRGFGSRFDQ